MDDTGDGRGIDGARVRDLRKARGWTQIDLAALACIPAWAASARLDMTSVNRG